MMRRKTTKVAEVEIFLFFKYCNNTKSVKGIKAKNKKLGRIVKCNHPR